VKAKQVGNNGSIILSGIYSQTTTGFCAQFGEFSFFLLVSKQI